MPLYVMLSRTGTGMGRLIRLFTRYQYNHVSLSLDPELRQFVSFARYVENVPLAGGFVEEPAERLLSVPGSVPVRIFQVEITPSQAAELEALFALAGQKDSGLIYNTFSALLTPLGLRLRVPGAYTCLEFAAAILGQPFPNLQALEAHLAMAEFFRGDLRERVTANGREGDYFCRRSFLGGTADTFRHFLRLSGRALRLTHCPDPICQYGKKQP